MVLTQRQKTTRKWPICLHCSYMLGLESCTIVIVNIHDLHYYLSCTGSNLAALDGGITPLPLATVSQLSRTREESMRFDFIRFIETC